MWQDGMALEINALNGMECFDFSDAHPSISYQRTILHMVFDCMQYMRQKPCLVAGECLVDILDNKVYLSKVKGISVKLLHGISQSAGLNTLYGDIGNDYVNKYTTEKVYVVAGPEFGPGLEGKIVVICKALYSHGADKKSYEYICTHVDDFCIFSKQADNVMAQIKAAYIVKLVCPPKYYLGNDFKRDSK
eukprot:13111713-Ditylum_brightwellii.AAC.1